MIVYDTKLNRDVESVHRNMILDRTGKVMGKIKEWERGHRVGKPSRQSQAEREQPDKGYGYRRQETRRHKKEG